MTCKITNVQQKKQPTKLWEESTYKLIVGGGKNVCRVLIELAVKSTEREIREIDENQCSSKKDRNSSGLFFNTNDRKDEREEKSFLS